MTDPGGWTIEQVRELSGRPNARLLPKPGAATVSTGPRRPYRRPLRAEAVVDFDGACLVFAEGGWYVGEFDESGTARCHGSYGPDLAAALRAL
ncbi:hypothetical protein [Kitasatospora sp. NPDC088134]|uniref:hypothetical protein n=1 Tax=Kitasatospora sp. NPDC088134 TaxID=3364071 RepID=UPI00382E5C4B